MHLYCAPPPTRRTRAHHSVNPYFGARKQNQTEMFSDHDEASPSVADSSDSLTAHRYLVVAFLFLILIFFVTLLLSLTISTCERF